MQATFKQPFTPHLFCASQVVGSVLIKWEQIQQQQNAV